MTLSIVLPLASSEVHADSLIGNIPVEQGPYGAVHIIESHSSLAILCQVSQDHNR